MIESISKSDRLSPTRAMPDPTLGGEVLNSWADQSARTRYGSRAIVRSERVVVEVLEAAKHALEGVASASTPPALRSGQAASGQVRSFLNANSDDRPWHEGDGSRAAASRSRLCENVEYQGTRRLVISRMRNSGRRSHLSSLRDRA